jgi:integrase
MRGSVVSKCSRGHRRADGRCSSRCTKWYFVTEGPRTPEGKRRRVWSSSFRTRREAEAALVAELSRRGQGIVLQPERLTLTEYVDRWLAHMRTTREASTVHRYEELLRFHVLPTLGSRQLKGLQPLEIQGLYDRLGQSGRRDGAGGLHPRTVGHVHRVLHRALKQAVHWHLVARNACEAVEPPKVAAEPMVTLTPAQARQLLDHAEGWLYHLVLLGAATGARRGELLALRWADVDLDTGTVRIARSVGLVGGQLHWKTPKTESGARTVVLGPSVVAELRRHRAAQAERRLAYGSAYHHDEDLVVAKLDGAVVRPDYASQAFRNLVRRAGLPKTIHVHSLRHSAASFLAAAGVPPSDIAAQLGHKDGGALALRVYVHAMAEGLARAGAHLDSVLAGQQ